jgi:hypothetical protein
MCSGITPASGNKIFRAAANKWTDSMLRALMLSRVQRWVFTLKDLLSFILLQ